MRRRSMFRLNYFIPQLRLDNVSLHYGTPVLLDGVDLSISKGSHMMIYMVREPRGLLRRAFQTRCRRNS